MGVGGSLRNTLCFTTLSRVVFVIKENLTATLLKLECPVHYTDK